MICRCCVDHSKQTTTSSTGLGPEGITRLRRYCVRIDPPDTRRTAVVRSQPWRRWDQPAWRAWTKR